MTPRPIIARIGMPAIIIMVAVSAVPAASASAQGDHTLYAGLLKRYVDGGVVDYQGLKAAEATLDRYLDSLAAVDPAQLSAPDRFAFYANAYNAWTIKLILNHYPGIESIKDAGSFLRSPWKKRFVRLEGRMMTLDEIEHDTLRAQFKDPRIHFAVNCASKGCPPLYREPFEGAKLEKQLDDVTRSFINDPARYRLDAKTLAVSRIFDWYRGDFDSDPVGFFIKYADGDLKARLVRQRAKLKVDYLAYDWSLNGS